MPEIITDEQKIDEILTRGVHEIFVKEELKKKLMSGKQLHLKLGVDVTGPNLHLGHTVIQRKIRDFQELGHRVTLIIGDFTTLVGDHSDKVDMRGEITQEQIKHNEEHFQDQFFKTVIKDQAEVRHNSEWLSKLSFADVIELAKQFTVAQMLDRETFLLRYQAKKPIGLDEFLYPLMQGYDSVALTSDVEFGGTDQTFNLLAGRKLMEYFGKPPQDAVVMKLLTGSDGRPMGKSLMNFIPVLDTAEDMYGKIMAIVDEVIFEYFELVTRVPVPEIEEMRKAVTEGANPMEFKKRLANEIVEFYHGKEAATEAQEYFEQTVQQGMTPQNIPEIALPENTQTLEVASLISKTSRSETRRVIEQGGFSVNNTKITDPQQLLELKTGDIIKFGKREFAKVK